MLTLTYLDPCLDEKKVEFRISGIQGYRVFTASYLFDQRCNWNDSHHKQLTPPWWHTAEICNETVVYLAESTCY